MIGSSTYSIALIAPSIFLSSPFFLCEAFYDEPALQAGGHWFESSSSHRAYREDAVSKVTEKDTVQYGLYPFLMCARHGTDTWR